MTIIKYSFNLCNKTRSLYFKLHNKIGNANKMCYFAKKNNNNYESRSMQSNIIRLIQNIQIDIKQKRHPNKDEQYNFICLKMLQYIYIVHFINFLLAEHVSLVIFLCKEYFFHS